MWWIACLDHVPALRLIFFGPHWNEWLPGNDDKKKKNKSGHVKATGVRRKLRLSSDVKLNAAWHGCARWLVCHPSGSRGTKKRVEQWNVCLSTLHLLITRTNEALTTIWVLSVAVKHLGASLFHLPCSLTPCAPLIGEICFSDLQVTAASCFFFFPLLLWKNLSLIELISASNTLLSYSLVQYKPQDSLLIRIGLSGSLLIGCREMRRWLPPPPAIPMDKWVDRISASYTTCLH